MEIIRKRDKRDWWWAIPVLSHARGDDEVYDCFYDVFRNPGPNRQYVGDALHALCDIRPESALPIIEEALDGPDLRLRGSAAWAAMSRGLLPSVEACVKAFPKGVGRWGRVCAGNLVLKHGVEGEKALEQIMRTGTAHQRATAAMALAGDRHPEAFDILVSELLTETDDRKWSRTVSHALGRYYGQELIAWIEAGRPDLTRAHDLVWTLVRIGQPNANKMVEPLFSDGTPSVRAAALRMIAQQKGAQSLPALRRCLREGRPRKVAQEAFWRVFRLADAALPTIEEMLESEHWTERKAALCLLRRWGKLTREQQARGESDPHVAVRHAANWHPG